MEKKKIAWKKIVVVTAILLAFLSFGFTMIMKVSEPLFYVVMPLITILTFSIFIAGMIFCGGWKTFNCKMIFGMPVGVFVTYLAVTFFIFIMVMINKSSTSPEIRNGVIILSFNLIISIVSSLIIWFSVLKKVTADIDYVL